MNGKKILTGPLRIAIALTIAGSLFIIMHWPYGRLIMTSGFIAIMILYFFRFFYKVKRSAIDILRLAVVLSWSLNGIFTILHLPGKLVLQMVTGVLIIIWLLADNIIFKGEESTNDQDAYILSKWLYPAGIIFVLTGILFKLMYWPGAGIFLIIGLLLTFLKFRRESNRS